MSPSQTGIDRRRMILMMRWVIIATAGYIVLATGNAFEGNRLLCVGLFALSNILLALVPQRVFQVPEIGPVLLLVDSAVTLFALSWNHTISQDILVVYFFTLFLVTVGDSLFSVAVGSALVMVLYGYWLSAQPVQKLNPDAWLRLPFFFLIAVFYGSILDQLKSERRRRESAEQESSQLRVLLKLAGTFSENHATRDFVNGIGRYVEEAAPNLDCRILLGDQVAAEADREIFPLVAQGHRFGALSVAMRTGETLGERERWLCQMVAYAASGALYAAEQSVAAGDANAAKEQFLATMSHELRTPLHAILGYTDILDTIVPDGDIDMRSTVDRVRVNACHLQGLIEQVLAFAELRAGNRALKPESMSVAELIDELEPTIREQVEDKPIATMFEMSEPRRLITTDRRKLRQLLLCLLGNATKFTDYGEISLSVDHTPDGATLFTVHDTGIGIRSEDLTRVLEDFRQADGSLTRRHGGLGLGLAMARELVDLLGGRMEIVSKPTEGTTVRVRLPAAMQKGIAPLAVAETAFAASRAPSRI